MDMNVHSISVKSAIENKLNTTWLKDQFEGSMMQIEKNVNEGVKNSENNAVLTTTIQGIMTRLDETNRESQDIDA
ncbi:33953_t:CDS:2 [Gigaspora margarita]|uniref:33953_t:CDS:1 n=1 Tax=Gigaspora margarita TaxID=4874 RepID=A0ABN7UEI3_GIGMA|nr:33953_t:CDS:2 [Gigaspora margarita]